MKVLKLLVDKDFIGGKLGLDSNEFVITEVESRSGGVELTIYTDDNVKVKEPFVLSEYEGVNHNLVRQNININSSETHLKNCNGDIIATFKDNQVTFTGAIEFSNVDSVKIKTASIYGEFGDDFVKTFTEKIKKGSSLK